MVSIKLFRVIAIASILHNEKATNYHSMQWSWQLIDLVGIDLAKKTLPNMLVAIMFHLK